ncbi:hypothetical protein JOL62DRAFT_132627 [Phyllosticta paracitricarpa]|uniref:Uncharacterized protein n=2 Tax=Phyllosticta TaxID=121621 RepID=A0ABR1MEH7_9PEZI
MPPVRCRRCCKVPSLQANTLTQQAAKPTSFVSFLIAASTLSASAAAVCHRSWCLDAGSCHATSVGSTTVAPLLFLLVALQTDRMGAACFPRLPLIRCRRLLWFLRPWRFDAHSVADPAIQLVLIASQGWRGSATLYGPAMAPFAPTLAAGHPPSTPS